QGVQVAASAITTPTGTAVSTLPTPALSLSDAVEQALLHSPQLRQAALAIRAAEGQKQSTRGPFDAVIRANPSLTVTKQALTPFLRDSEAGKRATIQTIADEFQTLTIALRNLLANSTTAPPRCPSDLPSFDSESLTLGGLDKSTLTLLGVNKP